MSYDISLMKDGEVCQVNNHQEGGVIQLGGSDEASINITCNYSFFFYNFLDKRKGIRWLYGKSAEETIPRLEKAIARLDWGMAGGVYEQDYWAPTFGNARHALEILLNWAKQNPDGIWEGD
jgi:hypothetical protein